MTDRFPGKHLALVVDNKDPKKLSRVRVRVPEIFADEETGWCLPCSPYAGAANGKGVGLAAVPPEGSLVFVEWPGGGDTTRTPIWSGALWADGNGVPGASPDAIVLVTPGGHRIALDDKQGSEKVAIEAKSGAKITLDKNGALVEFGSSKVKLTNSAVEINDGALKVS
jgi:uncharacterized protein involved in type VI secretion and phage assembly